MFLYFLFPSNLFEKIRIQAFEEKKMPSAFEDSIKKKITSTQWDRWEVEFANRKEEEEAKKTLFLVFHRSLSNRLD